MADSNHPHDALFKRTFSDVEHAAAEFRAVLPAKLVALTDFSTLALCPGSFVDHALAASHSDLLFSAQVASKPALLYILFEHQSSADKLMPLRLLRYVVRILERHAEGKTAADVLPLPLVVPVVLHHSEAGWTAAERLEDLFDPGLLEQAEVAHLVPRLSFVLDDLSRLSDQQLENRALGLVPALTLWALRDARSPARLIPAFTHWAAAMADLLRAPTGPEALAAIFRYITLVADDAIATTLAQAIPAVTPTVKEAFMTLAEKWLAEGEAKGKAEGEAKGKAEGEAKGKAEGEAKGKAEALRKLLTLKFGHLPESALTRLDGASIADLDRWLDRVLAASKLEDVLDA